MPTLYPADPQDVLDLGPARASPCPAASGLWVALKIATSVADGSGTVQVDPRPGHAAAGPTVGRFEHHVDAPGCCSRDLAELERSLRRRPAGRGARRTPRPTASTGS